MSDRPQRPIFCGNFEYDAKEREIVHLFEEYGAVERIDMKTGFAFVYMRSIKEGDKAIRDLDRREWGYKRRPLRVEWAKKSEDPKGKDQAPSRTLFVVNFDVLRTRPADLERFYERYGRIMRVDIKRNYAFVEFKDEADAIEAQRRTHGTPFEGRTITVEFVQNKNLVEGGGGSGGGGYDDRDRYGGGGRKRERSRSPPPARRRSPSPARRRRSPSPYDRRRPSPPRSRSPARRSASPPPYRSGGGGGGRRSRSRSPPYRNGGGAASPPPRRNSRSRSPMRD